MGYYTKTAMRLPPIIIRRGAEASVCGSGYDADLWLKAETMRSSDGFVIHDPGGSLLRCYGKSFRRNGYDIKAFNLNDIKKSARYNPFAYVRDGAGIMKLVTALMSGTKGLGKPGDANFLSCETMLFATLAGYVHDYAPEEERRIETLIIMLDYMMHTDGDEDYMNAVDFLFERAANIDPEHLSVHMNKSFKLTAGESAQRVIASCIARLALLMYSQLFDLLYERSV